MALPDAEFERQFAEATRRGEERLRYQPRAVAVRYDRRRRRVVVDLSNGCSLLVPTAVAEGLSTATAKDLEEVRVLGPGTTIAWPKLDVHFSVAGMLAGSFGTPSWMERTARRRSAVKTTRPRVSTKTRSAMTSTTAKTVRR